MTSYGAPSLGAGRPCSTSDAMRRSRMNETRRPSVKYCRTASSRKCIARVSSARFHDSTPSAAAQENDTVAVSASAIVRHTPDVRRLGEALFMDQHALAVEARGERDRHDVLFQPHAAAAHLADLESDVASASRDAMKL